MTKIYKIFLSLCLALGVTFGSTVVAPVAFADRADAYSTSQCREYIKLNVVSYTYEKWTTCYFDYSFWEETWFGGSHVDGWRSWRTGIAYA